MHIKSKSAWGLGLFLSFLFLCLSLGAEEEMPTIKPPKEDQIAITGMVVDIKTMPTRKQAKEESPLLIIVKAFKLIDKKGRQPLKNELWIFKVPPEKKALFKKYKTTDYITAYGYREGKARILRVIDKGVGYPES